MPHNLILITALFIIYYHICGLATTNILRLTAGNTKYILSSSCTCDNCDYKIPPLLQLPILSYFLCRGRCKNCGAKIPLFPLFLEGILLIGMCSLSCIFQFTSLGITISFLYYEGVRFITIAQKGKRKANFKKQLFIACFSMIPYYFCALFVALLYSVV